MPSLRQLDCKIEWANTGIAFDEYGTAYGDGIVETYIVIPDSPQTFSIHISSRGYIYEGLAVLVFMDGEYQCNRNRLNLKPPMRGLPKNATEIDFRLRQKEKPVGDGSFIGREWRFDTHNSVMIVPQDAHNGHFDELGNIEVIVLRCRKFIMDDSKSTSSSGVDSDPMSKDDDSDDAGNSFADNPDDEQDEVAQTLPASAPPVEEGGSILGGIFDGANDYRQPHFGGDGPTHGYWTYHPYPQSHGTHPGGLRYDLPNDFNKVPAPARFPPDQPPPVPTSGPVPEKHVHFEMGGTPNTRAGPPPQQWPNATFNAPPGPPPPATDPSEHGAGQQHGYPVHPNSVPFDGVPFYLHRRPINDYGNRYFQGGQGYDLFPTAPQYHYSYPYGHGVTPGYNHYPYSYYQPGQWYGQPQGATIPAPAASQHAGPTNVGSSADLAKDDNNLNDNWEAHNSGESSGNNGWGEDNTNGNNNVNENNEDWNNDNANNDAYNGNEKNNNWTDQNNSANNDDQWANNDNSGSGTGWQGQFQAQNPNQNELNWDNGNNSGNNNNNNDQGQNWSSGDQNNSKPPHDAWSQAAAAHIAEEAKQQSQSMPSAFPPTQQRALYGPHGPYYMLKAVTADNIKPEVEEEPRYDVPISHIAQTGSTHQVQPGRGYLYLHKRGRPSYIDSIESPYARFVFKYRTKAQIANEIGVHVDMEPSSNSEVQYLATKTKEEIIDMLLRAKSALGGKIPEPPEKTKEELDDPKSLKPIAVPVPERRFGKYNIPMRHQPPQHAGLGISDPNLRNTGSGGWQENSIPPNQQQNGGCAGPSYGHNNNNAGGKTGADQWSAPPQYSNQGQSWDNGGAEAYGNPGTRPPSPQAQSAEWGNGGGNGGGAGGQGASALPDSVW